MRLMLMLNKCKEIFGLIIIPAFVFIGLCMMRNIMFEINHENEYENTPLVFYDLFMLFGFIVIYYFYIRYLDTNHLCEFLKNDDDDLYQKEE